MVLQKFFELDWHLVIKFGERPLPIIWKIIMHCISMLALDDHVVRDHTSIHDLTYLS
jgi:hypothetical protein